MLNDNTAFRARFHAKLRAPKLSVAFLSEEELRSYREKFNDLVTDMVSQYRFAQFAPQNHSEHFRVDCELAVSNLLRDLSDEARQNLQAKFLSLVDNALDGLALYARFPNTNPEQMRDSDLLALVVALESNSRRPLEAIGNRFYRPESTNSIRVTDQLASELADEHNAIPILCQAIRRLLANQKE